MKSPPILSDEEAQHETARARAYGAEIVRDHLENHLQHNQGRSSDFVTWIATLHPENADVTIDERFLIPGNPWWTIYEQAKNDLPSATAVPVEREVSTAAAGDTRQAGVKPLPVRLCQMYGLYFGSPCSALIGTLMTFHAVLGVLICELTAFIFFGIGFVMYSLANCFDPDHIVAQLFYSLFMMIYSAFSLSDSICLLTSVFITEILASTTWIVTALIAGIWVANSWHQYIRRVCHSVRWAMRSPFEEPPRHFSLLCMTPSPPPSSDLKGRENVVKDTLPEATIIDDGDSIAVRRPHTNTTTALHDGERKK